MDKLKDEVKFDEKGLVPVIVQDHITNEVLMMAYMNKEALDKTMETGKAHYWSRSRQKLWLKGETSGHFQYVKAMSIDCDGDTLLIKVEQVEAACHTGNYSCFYRTVSSVETAEAGTSAACCSKTEAGKAAILEELYNVVVGRVKNPKQGSYTNYLFEKGLDKICKKVGEEASEVIIAAKNKSKEEIRYEVADLFYHIIVLLVERGLKLDDIYDELAGRREK